MSDSPLASPEWAGFVTSMRFAPLDDTPRLVAADWLQDTGRPELEAWADFVRFQVEAARNKASRTHLYVDSCDCGACRPERRAAILHDRWAAHWGMHSFSHVTPTRSIGKASDFERGFVGSVTVTLKETKLSEVPADVSPLYARVPLPVVAVNLRYVGGSFRNWEMRVTHKVNPSGYLTLSAEIAADLARGKVYRASRIVGRHNDFARNVRGVVRQALANRHETITDPTTGAAP